MANPYFLTYAEVADQIISFLPPSWQASMAGKVLKRLIVAFGLSIEALYALLARLLRLAIAATSEGDWLKAIVRGWGMSAFDGISASGLVRMTRYSGFADAVLIPVGTEVGATFGQTFKTTQAAVLTADEGRTEAQYVDVPCVCTKPGAQGNIRIGEVISFVTPVPGVDDLTNPNPFVGGADGETDAQIKARIAPYLASLHRATIPATEYIIAQDKEQFPEVLGFITQRNYGTPGYFRGVVSDFSGGDLYRARGWIESGGGVYFIQTALTEINGLVAAGYPCQRFGVVSRAADGKEIWNASAFVAQVEQGNWRFCHDRNLGRLYARADGRDLNTLEITIVAGVVWRSLQVLEEAWAGNGVFCDVVVPFVVQDVVSINYALEPGYVQTAVETALRNAISDYVAGLALGQAFELEGLYSALSLVPGAAGVLATSPGNVAVPSDSVFRLAAPPTITRRAA